MKKIAALLLISLSACFAQINLPAVLVIDGKQYAEVSYISHDAARVKFSHDSGMASVEIAKMPEEIRAALGYNPGAAAEAENALAEQAAETAKAIALKKRIASEKAAALAVEQEQQKIPLEEREGVFRVIGEVISVKPIKMAPRAEGHAFVRGLSGVALTEKVSVHAKRTEELTRDGTRIYDLAE